jgi:hypothetical protein
VAADPLLSDLCAILADPAQAAHVVTSDATGQMFFLAKAGRAASVACDGVAGCWVIQPLCYTDINGFACDATPLRAI